MSVILEALKRAQAEGERARDGDKGEPREARGRDFMEEEQNYLRLVETLLDVTHQLSRQIRPIEEQLVQVSIDHLRQRMEWGKRRLLECLAGIDQHLLDCRSLIEECNTVRANIRGLNERLASLGGSPLPVIEEEFGSADLEEVLKERIAGLRSQGKL